MTGTQSDEQLVRHALQGRADDFGALVKRYYRLAYGIAFAYTGSAADAEDLSQESFLKAYRSLDTLREIGRFRAWLIRIVRNECHDWRARQGRDRPPAAAETQVPETASPDVETKELFEFLWRELEGLDDTSREILTIYYFLGKNTREMARHLDISVSAAEKRLQRARHVLGERLSGRLDDALEPYRPDEGNAQRAAHAVIAFPVAWNSVQVAALLGTGEAATTLSFGTVIAWVFVIAAIGSASLLVYSKRMQDRLVTVPEDGRPAAATEAANRDDERRTPEISTDAAEDKGNTTATTTGTPDLTVYVTGDEAGNPPLPKAKVTVIAIPQGEFSATTNKDGAAVFYDIPWGNLGIVVTRDQYLNQRLMYDLEQSDASVRVALARGQAITGQVVAADTGEPVTDFSIQLLGARPRPDKPLPNSPMPFHDAQGRFTVPNILEAQFIAVRAPDYLRTEISLAHQEDWGNISIRLKRAVVVAGRVHDTRGQAIAGARVESRNDYDSLVTVLTAEDGTFQATMTDERYWSLRVIHENYLPGYQRVPEDTPPGARLWFDFELVPAASVEGVVRYNGKPWPDALISSGYSRAVSTNERGEYVVAGLAPGSHMIDARLPYGRDKSDYFAKARQLVSLEEGQQSTIDFNFEPATSSIVGYFNVPGADSSQYRTSHDYLARALQYGAVPGAEVSQYRTVVLAQITGSAGSEIRWAQPQPVPGQPYLIENVPAGQATLTAEVMFAGERSIDWRQVMVEIPPDTEVRQDFTFTSSASVQAHITGIPEGYAGDLRLLPGKVERWSPEVRVPVAGYRFVESDGDVTFQLLDADTYTIVLRIAPIHLTLGGVTINRASILTKNDLDLIQPHGANWEPLGPYPSGPDAAISVVEVAEGETATVQLSVSL